MIDSASQTIRELLAQNRSAELIEFIRKEQPDLLTLSIDDKKSTLLHYSASSNNLEIIRFLLPHSQQHYSLEERLRWVNKPNIEQFAALHLASYEGNIECVELLLSMGADPNLRSGSGLLPIHAAAQGDHPFMIRFWILQGTSLDVKDDIGNTCLHWATYQGCELCVNYLLSWNCNLNIQNAQKQTALHIGVIYGQVRIVKKLLIRGAQKFLQDNDGRLPLDLARENQYQLIQNMLQDSSSLAILCSLKQPYHPSNRNLKSVVAFCFLFLTSHILISWPVYETSLGLFISDVILAFITFILFACVTQSNPGVLNRRLLIDEIIKSEKIKPSQICPDCQMLRPSRTKHCEICNRCVVVYDHHCPWVNNCIGAKNLRLFFIFLASLSISNLIAFAAIITCFASIRRNENSLTKVLLLFCPICVLVVFFFPIMLLLLIQLKNIVSGMTQYERNLNSKAKRSFLLPDDDESTEGSFYIQSQRGLKKSKLDNCLDMCCRNSENYNQYMKL